MYARKHFTEEEMTKYKILLTNEKDDWAKTHTYFATLYVMRKEYSEERFTESEFKSVANITHIAPEMSVDQTSIN